MDWNDFFERTRVAADVDSFSKLAPRLGITDGAIGHYRQGRRVPQVWVVAEALKIQGHPTPEKAAIQIMKAAALSSPERAFWRRLAATTAVVLMSIVLFPSPSAAGAPTHRSDAEANQATGRDIMRNVRWWARLLWLWLGTRFARPSGPSIEARTI